MKNRLFIAAVLSLTLTGCYMITDECLPSDLREQFKQENRDGVVISESCTVEILDQCVLSGECTILIELSEECNGYKYFFDEKYCDELEIRERMKSLKYIEKSEYNFASTKFENNGKTLWLYVAGYANEKTAGRTYGPNFRRPYQIDLFNERVSELPISVSDGLINMKFPALDYDVKYCVLFDDEADYAKGLTDAEVVLYTKKYDWNLLPQTEPRTVSIERESHSRILVVTRVSASDVIKSFYNKDLQ